MRTLAVLVAAVAAVFAPSTPAQILAAPFQGDSRAEGVMFDVHATNAVKLCRLWLDLGPRNDAVTLRIYTRAGTHVGHETQSGSWVELGTVGAVSKGTRVAVPILLDLGQIVSAGAVQAYYVVVDGAGVVEERLGVDLGTPRGTVLDATDDAVLESGTAISGLFGGVVGDAAPHAFVQYTTDLSGPCPPPQLPVTRLPSIVYDGAPGVPPLETGEVYEFTAGVGGTVTIPIDETWTVPDGAVVQLLDGSGNLIARELVVRGTLNAGAATFTSLFDDESGGDTTGSVPQRAATPGDWYGIRVVSTGTVALDGTQIAYAGGSSSRAPLGLGDSFDSSLTDLFLRDNGLGNGAALDYANSTNTVAYQLVFQDNAGVAADNLDWLDLPNMSGLGGSGNGGNYTIVRNGASFGSNPITTDVTVRAENLLSNTLVVDGSGTATGPTGALRFDDGIVVKFTDVTASGLQATNGGRLVANGKPGNPIVFTTIHDDDHGALAYVPTGTPRPTPAPGDWGTIRTRTNGRIDLAHAVIRFAGRIRAAIDLGGRIDRVDAVEICQADRYGFYLDGQTGVITNAIVDRTNGDGVQAFDGDVELLSATVIDSVGVGFLVDPQWIGRIANSNFWNNAGGNFGPNVPGSRVFSSNGGFAGLNDNRNVPPQFDPNDPTKLRATSPLIDAGDNRFVMLSTAPTDARGNPRIGGPNLITDIGAREYDPAELEVLAFERRQIELIVAGQTIGVGAYLFGAGLAATTIPNFGTLLLSGPLVATPFQPLPARTTIRIPEALAGLQIYAQAFYAPGTPGQPARLTGSFGFTVSPALGFR